MPADRSVATAAPHPIGSEGYGPHIQAALESGDAARAWQAFNWLRNCKTNASVVAEAEQQLRGRPNLPAEAIARLIESSQAEARRCQTVTPALAALEPQLALSAMRGGIAGAAAAYARAMLSQEQDTTGRVELLAALQRDAMQGHRETLEALLTGGSRLGIGDVERRAYRLALESLHPNEGLLRVAAEVPTLAELVNVRVSAADELRAKALADQIIAAGRRAAQPPRP